MITVSFGTPAQATAVTSFAPSLAIPPASARRPTMKPVMFCRNRSGISSRAQLDEMCPLERAFGEQHAVVGENPHRIAAQVRKPAYQSGAVELLELIELGCVHQAREHLAYVVGVARVRRSSTAYCRRICP